MSLYAYAGFSQEIRWCQSSRIQADRAGAG